MRLTEFWENMATTFGDGYAESVAADQTLPQLDGKTINEALSEGWDTKHVWIAVCQAYGDRVPARIRRLTGHRTPVRYYGVRKLHAWRRARAVTGRVYRERHG